MVIELLPLPPDDFASRSYTPTEILQDLLTVGDVAHVMKVSRQRVHQWIGIGTVPALPTRAGYLIPIEFVTLFYAASRGTQTKTGRPERRVRELLERKDAKTHAAQGPRHSKTARHLRKKRSQGPNKDTTTRAVRKVRETAIKTKAQAVEIHPNTESHPESEPTPTENTFRELERPDNANKRARISTSNTELDEAERIAATIRGFLSGR